MEYFQYLSTNPLSMYHTTIQALFQSRNILHALDRLSDSESRSICMIPFGSVHDIFDKLPKKRFVNKKLTEHKRKNRMAMYELEAFSKSTGKLQDSGKLILYKPPEFKYSYLLIFIDHTDFFHRYLRSFIEQYHTEIILPFIKSKELMRLIEAYQSRNSIDEIIITRASQKIRYHDESRITAATWNNSSLEDAYTWLQENDGFFKSIQFKALRSGKEITSSYIDRRGMMRIDKHFSKLYYSLTIPTIQLLENYIRLFNNRGRRDNDTLEVHPLKISFDKDIFREKENHIRFISMLSRLEDTSVSVMHGNPYIHISILDYMDGSTCDLWVLEADKLLIIPQLRSTIISLQRIVNHIFDDYAEGEIQDHEK